MAKRTTQGMTMDDHLLARLDRMEKKIDELLEFKWKIVGMSTIGGVLGAAVFKMILGVL